MEVLESTIKVESRDVNVNFTFLCLIFTFRGEGVNLQILGKNSLKFIYLLQENDLNPFYPPTFKNLVIPLLPGEFYLTPSTMTHKIVGHTIAGRNEEDYPVL